MKEGLRRLRCFQQKITGPVEDAAGKQEGESSG